MKFVQYQDCKSPHQLPLARELLQRLGMDDFRYVYRDADQAGRAALGWQMGGADEPWQLHVGSHPGEARELIENADVLLTGMRELDLFERRASKGLKTLYQTERWFKPICVAGCMLPGRMRLMFPKYRRLVAQLMRLARISTAFHILPIGVHSMQDMRSLGVPDEKMTIWGYFVSPSVGSEHELRPARSPVRVLWAGRMLKLKHVDTIIEAVKKVLEGGVCGDAIQLLLVGNGPERARLERIADGLPVSFMDSVPIGRIRELMRKNDVYVFSSDGRDGWGAVVSEALEEGMVVLGTCDTGASATMLPPERQFCAGDAIELAALFRRAVVGEFHPTGIGEWSASKAADKICALT